MLLGLARDNGMVQLPPPPARYIYLEVLRLGLQEETSGDFRKASLTQPDLVGGKERGQPSREQGGRSLWC